MLQRCMATIQTANELMVIRILRSGPKIYSEADTSNRGLAISSCEYYQLTQCKQPNIIIKKRKSYMKAGRVVLEHRFHVSTFGICNAVVDGEK